MAKSTRCSVNRVPVQVVMALVGRQSGADMADTLLIDPWNVVNDTRRPEKKTNSESTE